MTKGWSSTGSSGRSSRSTRIEGSAHPDALDVATVVAVAAIDPAADRLAATTGGDPDGGPHGVDDGRYRSGIGDELVGDVEEGPGGGDRLTGSGLQVGQTLRCAVVPLHVSQSVRRRRT